MPEYFSENLETKHVGEEVHPGESVEEKISLSERFGLWVSFYPFAQDDYLAAVAAWLAHFGVKPPASRARRARRARAKRCSSRCSAARAAAASRGSSPSSYAGARALREVTRAIQARERDARSRRRRRRSLRPDGRVLLAQRPAGKPYAGYWEFPGGKLEPGETPRAALARELHEELGITVTRAAPWLTQEFVYPHAHVELNFFRVFDWDGRAGGPRRAGIRVADAGRVRRRAAAAREHARARGAVAAAGLRRHAARADLGEDAFLAARRARVRATACALVQLREKDWPIARRDAFARQLAAARARASARACC